MHQDYAGFKPMEAHSVPLLYSFHETYYLQAKEVGFIAVCTSFPIFLETRDEGSDNPTEFLLMSFSIMTM